MTKTVSSITHYRMASCSQWKQCSLWFYCFTCQWSGGKIYYFHSLLVISGWALCSCSSWRLTTREKQCVLGRCLGATQCQQRALRLQSVCFLYLSVSSLLLFEHTITHCASLLVLFLKSQAPLLSSNRFRWLPLLWHWTASWKYAIWAFPVLWNPLIIRDIE